LLLLPSPIISFLENKRQLQKDIDSIKKKIYIELKFQKIKECSFRAENGLFVRAGLYVAGRHQERHARLDLFVQRF
jgi:UDP-N-acetylglucosamine pyrophosphorylase